MTIVEIRIQDIEDKDKPLIPELKQAQKLIHGNLQFFGILERGMKSGATSVSFTALAEDGTAVVLETSANNFLLMAAALRGAEERFLEKQANKN